MPLEWKATGMALAAHQRRGWVVRRQVEGGSGSKNPGDSGSMFEWLSKIRSVLPQQLGVKPRPVPSTGSSATPPPGVAIENLRAVVRTSMNAVQEIDPHYSPAIYEAALRCLEESRGENLAIIGEAVSTIEGLTSRRRSEICQLIIRPAAVLLENQRRLAAGITHAIWATPGGAPCGGEEMTARHAKLDGRRYRLDAGLLVGKKRLYPGAEPGCRCTSTAVID